MPTNLPPQYSDADKRYRAATTPEEKIESLQEMLSIIPKHKGTDKLRADLRRKLSKLKSASQAPKSVGKRVSAFNIDKEGAGQVAVVGPTNVGKSSLVAQLTNAEPEISHAPNTTWKPTPGMMPVENIQIQLIDTPPLGGDYIEPELPELIRRSDLIFLVVDLQADPMMQLEETIALLQEYRIIPRHLKDRFTEKRRLTFLPLIVLANKSDNEALDEDYEVFCELLDEEWPSLPISVINNRNLDRLKQIIIDTLEIIRVYSKAPGKEPDLGTPFTLKKGVTVEEFAGKVHKDFLKKMKTARVWGSAQFDGQMVKRDYVLQDGDVVELRI